MALSRGLSQVPNRTVLLGDMGPCRETFLVVTPWVGAAAGRMPLAPERQRSRTPRASRQPRDQEPSWPHVTCARWGTPLVLFTLRLPAARSPRPDAPVAFGGDGPGALINRVEPRAAAPSPEAVAFIPHSSPSFRGSRPPQENKRAAFRSWLRKPAASSTAEMTSLRKIPGKRPLRFAE